MAKKNKHIVYRNSNLFCSNCGIESIITYPIDISILVTMADRFAKVHKNCKPVWKQPEPDMTQSIQERIVWWTKYGEHGTSSKTIWCILTNGSDFKFNYEDLKFVFIPEIEYTHPSDPDDFKRCYMLLKAVPEWRNELYKLNGISPVWERMVWYWDKLTKKLEQQIKTGKTNNMYELMKTLGC